MIFHWRLSDSKSPQVSRSLLSILVDLSHAVVLDSLHSSFYFQVLQSLYWSFGDCIKSANSQGFFFNSLVRSRYLFFLFSFNFTQWSAGRAKSTILQVLFFFIVIRSGRYYYYYSSRVFHISISWWFFTGVWVTASLLKSPGLVSVFWPSSAMLSFR